MSIPKQSNKNLIKDITPSDANKLIEEHKNDSNFIILDVRTPWEFSEDHIMGAVNLDFTDPEFEEMVEKLDNKKTYLIYCKSGVRGGKVSKLFLDSGFQEVYNISGGFEGWKNELHE
jgi:rhodanese-related sulfurtransferase